MHQSVCLAILVAGLALALQGGRCSRVPVFAWERSRSDGLAGLRQQQPAERAIQEAVASRLGQGVPVVVFTEAKLDPEDFSAKNSKGESNLLFLSERKGSENTIAYWPSVQDPVAIIKALPGVKVREELYTDDNNLDDMLSSHGDALIVDFSNWEPESARGETLRSHDNAMEKLYQKLLVSHPDVLAIFTGKASTYNSGRSKRAAETKGIDFIGSNVQLYISGPGIIRKMKGDENTTVDGDFKTDTASRTDGLVFTLKKGDSSVEFNITSSNGYWLVTSIRVNSVDMVEDIAVPIGFSYHCSLPVFVDRNRTLSLELPGMQLQAFFNDTKLFGDAYDCVGFTSAPIWSGIFVTFILGLILAVGLIMLMDIKTMDRFDDPKGKTITVNVAE